MRLPLVLLLLPAALAVAQDRGVVAARYRAQEDEAFRYYRGKEWVAAVAAFERQIAIFPDNPRPYYNIACVYALQGDADRAGTWLSLAISRGWRDAEHLAGDPDFDLVRASPQYVACLAQLGRARRLDPDPLPSRRPFYAAAPARTALEAISDTQAQLQRLPASRALLDPHRYRRELFAVCDARMARLNRYLAENGDARDAPQAGFLRVSTALRYLQEADGESEADRKLARTAAAYVLEMVEGFLRGWPGDPRLPDVFYARAHALRRLGREEEAERELRGLIADHPRTATAPVALVELCAMLAAQGRREELGKEWAALQARARGDERVEALLRGKLMAARLLVDGMPNVFDLDAAVAAQADGHEGLFLYACVLVGDPESERLLQALPRPDARLMPVVVCLDRADRVAETDLLAWLKEHAAGLPAIGRGADAIDRLWLDRVPVTILARRDGTVLAIDPSADELSRLLRRGSR